MGDLELSRAEDGLAPDRLVTREWGSRGGRPLVFWPSLNPWGALQLVEAGPLLAEHGFHVLSVEPPSLSEPDAYLPTKLARLVLDLTDEAFLYVGASWGASIGVHLGADHPDRVSGLVLLDGGHVDITPVRPLAELVKHFEAEQAAFAFDDWEGLVEYARQRVRSWRPTLEPRYREGMKEEDGKIVPRARATAAAWAVHGVMREPPSAALRRLTVPTLLLVAKDNPAPKSALRHFRASVPTATVETIDAGHDLIEDAPEETVAAVLDWLG